MPPQQWPCRSSDTCGERSDRPSGPPAVGSSCACCPTCSGQPKKGSDPNGSDPTGSDPTGSDPVRLTGPASFEERQDLVDFLRNGGRQDLRAGVGDEHGVF